MLDEDPQSILWASGIEQRLDDRIHRHSISGGQAQRISLIRALDPKHEVVLLDEPTSALDARSAAALRERVANDDADRIFVMVTHDAELRAVADVVVEVE
jgi:ABC-type transport system involved in cytochrome bd biosynthesis fused ATPase/permease subunit